MKTTRIRSIAAALAVLCLALPSARTFAGSDHTFVGGNQPQTLAERYCTNIGDKAADIRAARQMQQLKKLSADIKKRAANLKEELVELKEWVRRRDEFMKRGTDALVNIFASMRPDAASLQLVAIDERTAAAILMKLKPRMASSILNEMDPERAARLAATIAGAARFGNGGKT